MAKVTRALDAKDGGDGGPDVIEVGNTQVPQYVDGGGLLDLSLESARGTSAWRTGCPDSPSPASTTAASSASPGTPPTAWSSTTRDLFAAAGIKNPPTTRDEWLDLTRSLDSDGRQGIYLAGQDWYTLSGFIWDEGGELAHESAGTWTGALDTPRRCAAWTSTAASRRSGRGRGTPTRNTPRRPTSSPAGTSARSSRRRAQRSGSSRRTPALKGSWGSSPSRARPPTAPDRSSPAAPTSSSPRTPATGRAPSPVVRPWPARSGTPSWPGP
ncbi:extracellular solute-binding protein [Streptomyces sp. KL116D]|uniref:extracellular solute-binding protein n=1 Tax=Streptomyces sp. KL116D TaxID=3045152 RepID=UPI0035571D95